MENDVTWEVAIELYPGILAGFRTHRYEMANTHVLYLPFISFSLTVFQNQDFDEPV